MFMASIENESEEKTENIWWGQELNLDTFIYKER